MTQEGGEGEESLRMKENKWERRKERKENNTQYIFHVCCFYKYNVNYCPWWGVGGS